MIAEAFEPRPNAHLPGMFPSDSVHSGTYVSQIASRISWDGTTPAPLELIAPLKTQVGGDHYTSLAIQPVEFSIANGLNACQHSIIKYVVRKKGDKEARLKDLDKAIHFIELYKQFIEQGQLAD